ncbi:MAG TPA: methionyl-tRNA formyltransferase [Terriglobales bacterium]|nr:methionyl-tRNA formyltransferase [Terriglobales bacterium]
MRIVFLGTPEFAVPTLEGLARTRGIEVVAAVCQPDRPAGRRGEVRAPAVKLAAERLGVAVHQPERLRGAEAVAWLEAQRPEALAVVAFGQLLPAAIFNLPRLGAINAHASLLPAYRGAAPMQWAIALGETKTGVTTMRINAGLDTGDMLLQHAVEIGPKETMPELSRRLAEVAAELMVATFGGLEAGTIRPRPQPAEGTLAPMLRRADGRIQPQWTARDIYNRWRGFQPWPGIYLEHEGKRLAVLDCQLGQTGAAAAASSLRFASGTLTLACAAGTALALDTVRLEGRQAMSGAEFARGARL